MSKKKQTIEPYTLEVVMVMRRADGSEFYRQRMVTEPCESETVMGLVAQITANIGGKEGVEALARQIEEKLR